MLSKEDMQRCTAIRMVSSWKEQKGSSRDLMKGFAVRKLVLEVLVFCRESFIFCAG